MFQIHSKYFLLTYPEKSDKILTKEIIKAKLLKKFALHKANILDMIVAKESSDGEDSYEHYHVYLKLDRRFKVQKQDFFDLNKVHGRYESCKSPKATKSYVTKDDDFISYKKVILSDKPYKSELVQYIENYILTNSPTNLNKRELYHKALLSLNSSQRAIYCLNKLSIDNAVQRSLILTNPNLFQNRYKDFEVNSEIIDWLQNHMHKTTLVLLGPSGFGKTEFAKSIFNNPLLVRHTEQLKNLEHNHDGIIYDDFDFSSNTTEEVIKILDLENDSTVNVKHSAAIVPSLLPRIITSNKESHEIFPKDPHGAIKRRTFTVILILPLLPKASPQNYFQI